ncbi:MauE/DoxX family redox-associated membrane protein [Pontiellaceae bacterium B12219]|nr:MauE/DoxX family redox-associated membrane protein [Pontiellaceae bacterium B12219]
MAEIWRGGCAMTSDQKVYRFAYWFACLIVAATLLSGYHKILYPADFALSVYRFHLLPDFLVNIASLYFQWLEIVCGIVLLFIPKFRVAALWIAGGLLVVFSGAIGISLVRGTAFSCGCFSNAPDALPMSGMSLARNGALLALCGLALYAQRKWRIKLPDIM